MHIRYLVKPHDSSWKEGLLALEAGAFTCTDNALMPLIALASPGSGVGALRELLNRDPHLLDEPGGQPSAHDVYSAIR